MEFSVWRVEIRENCKHRKGRLCEINNTLCTPNDCPALDKQAHPLPFVSDGNNQNTPLNNNEGVVPLSKRQQEAIILRNQGFKLKDIAKKMGVSYQAIQKLLFKAKAKIGVVQEPSRVVRKESHLVELHNDSFGFEIFPVNVTRVKGKLVKLKYTSYKKTTNEDYHIKVFREKLVVQFRKSIVGSSVEEVTSLADARLIEFLASFSFKGIRFRNKKEQLQRHYALLGTGLAKKYVREGRKLLVLDRETGEERVKIDLSDGFSKPHFEVVKVDKAEFDADRWHHLIEDATHEPIDLLSVTKRKTDFIVDVLAKYAEQMDLHLEVERRTNINQTRLNEAITELKDVLKKIEKKLN